MPIAKAAAATENFVVFKIFPSFCWLSISIGTQCFESRESVG